MACGILVPPPGIEPTPPAVEVQSLNYWTTVEVSRHLLSLQILDGNPGTTLILFRFLLLC